MSLEFTSVPPIPRGMNLAGPSLYIDDAYCKWMQDVLVDRPGQIRMRGPMSDWISPTTANFFTTGQQALGATSTVTPNGSWRGAVFATGSSTTDGVIPASNGIVKVFSNASNGASQIENTFTLPFKLNTKYNSTTEHWEANTIIDAKPALGGGVWIGITDEYGVLTSADSKQALMLWRGGSKSNYAPTGSYAAKSKNITLTASVGSNIDSGMFAFDNHADADGNGRYLGVVASVSGSTVTLEKEVIYTATSGTLSNRTLLFTSLRGFVPQHGRGVSSTDTGVYITSGRLGSDAEGLFGAARTTISPDVTGAAHRVFTYRQSDHRFVGQIKWNGTVSNTQVEMASANHASLSEDFLKDDNYLIIRDDTNLFTTNNNPEYDTKKYSMLASNRRPDSNPELVGEKARLPIPGIFNSTYANRQWFASVGNTAINSDKFINRVVFSGTDNPENINLSPDASDSIIIPGREAIRGIAGSVSGLLVFVESKTYIIRGTNRQNFALEELYPDGTLCTSSIVQVGGGVIWAGKAGIYYYDGVTVRNFTNEALGIFYTDGISAFNAITDRVYAFVYNNYLIINFSKWDQNYVLKRWQVTHQNTTGSGAILGLDNAQDYTRLKPNSLTFNIFLPTGAIGTLSNFTPRGFMTASSAANTNTKGLMVTNSRSIIPTTGATGTGTSATITMASNPYEIDDTVTISGIVSTNTVGGITTNSYGYNGIYKITAKNSTSITFDCTEAGTYTTAGIISDYTGVPTSNTARIANLSSIFTEILDEITYDSIFSNDSNRSSSDVAKRGPDFYFETKQYNFGESTLRKWWRKLLFNISINTGFVFTEFVDINDTSLVDDATFSSYTDTTSSSFSVTASGTVFPYQATKSFTVSNAADLNDSDYLKLINSKIVTNKVAGSGNATLTIASHGLSSGDTIRIKNVDPALDGLRTLNLVTTNTIRFPSSASIADTAVQIVPTAATGNGTTATLTVPNTTIMPKIGDSITISGMTPAGYNGTYTISAIDNEAHTISYANTTTGNMTVAGIIRIGVLEQTIFGYVIDKQNNDITFRLTKTTSTGTHANWTISRQTNVNSSDQTGFIVVPNTSLTWGYYENTALTWDDIQTSGLSWEQYFGNKLIRYSQWLGIRQNSLGFRFYSLRNYSENGGEQVPETIDINDWVFGLKPLRKGRN